VKQHDNPKGDSMKLTTLLGTATFVLGLTGMAQAVTMVAGPLTTTTSCSCLIVNVTTSAKTIHVQLLDKTGTVVPNGELGPQLLQGGDINGVSAPAVGNFMYCKFINAATTSFRASMVCDGVALPAR
jgi:hypothetical protein